MSNKYRTNQNNGTNEDDKCARMKSGRYREREKERGREEEGKATEK